MFGIHALQERISESASCSSKDDDDDVVSSDIYIFL